MDNNIHVPVKMQELMEWTHELHNVCMIFSASILTLEKGCEDLDTDLMLKIMKSGDKRLKKVVISMRLYHPDDEVSDTEKQDDE